MARTPRSSAPSLSDEAILSGIRAALAKIVENVPAGGIGLDTSLVDDLGLDSIRFVDFAVALEETLGIPEFPLQGWIDAELGSPGETRFTVRALLSYCRRAVSYADARPS
jgi:acyl carrier protein